MSSATLYKWPSKYGGMNASLMSRLKALEDESLLLKKMYAENRLKAEMIQETLAKNGEAILFGHAEPLPTTFMRFML
jgi:putative transposase